MEREGEGERVDSVHRNPLREGRREGGIGREGEKAGVMVLSAEGVLSPKAGGEAEEEAEGKQGRKGCVLSPSDSSSLLPSLSPFLSSLPSPSSVLPLPSSPSSLLPSQLSHSHFPPFYFWSFVPLTHSHARLSPLFQPLIFLFLSALTFCSVFPLFSLSFSHLHLVHVPFLAAFFLPVVSPFSFPLPPLPPPPPRTSFSSGAVNEAAISGWFVL